jgi:hypothetical protein
MVDTSDTPSAGPLSETRDSSTLPFGLVGRLPQSSACRGFGLAERPDCVPRIAAEAAGGRGWISGTQGVRNKASRGLEE